MAKNPFKQLAGETAIYGLSTILARVVNFLLVPLYTNILSRENYGIVTEFLAYIAILQVVLALGLETGCFRYAQKEKNAADEGDATADPNRIFSNAFMIVLGLCLLFFAGVSLFSKGISTGLGYPGFQNVIIYVGAILLIDTVTAILFARLRYEHKALKFAVVKTLKIFTELGVNLLLYLALPIYLAGHDGTLITKFVSATPDFTYAIFAIFISCIVCLLMLLPELFRLRFVPDKKVCKALLVYSIPLMLAGLPGVMNDLLDRVLMRGLDGPAWRADLGVYQAGVKIAVIMSLFVQMFRYAAEPFFFQREKQKDSKTLYAQVMTYFVAFCMAGFLFVLLYLDVIGLMLGKDFRIGLAITPIMLMAYVMLGMQFNISMWYKLSGKTGYAVWITLAGLAVTIIINVLFMPRYSYHAAAWAHIASYLVMMVLALALGNKYYPIPYNWKKIIALIAFALAIYGGSLLLPEMSLWPKMGVHTLLMLLYLVPTALYLYKTRNTI
ncbi:MAG: polysaccharide biosynthesis protein [Bacteroidales bacterium]|nr:polysaccharide biosynthesis protein [Bacteroidales bacterium]